ncbi:hypothetical protein MPL1032_30235 [Mesorhizobium plurifarium]|uniref:Uncharacterized protein n=1 Tax=Mesorhizobium plurifarium TaxID=69974 RepID=A0A0K2W338_MESPL|nr:hypothetical protein MPL1032_30235 [Mesorhizobium plurifarium]
MSGLFRRLRNLRIPIAAGQPPIVPLRPLVQSNVHRCLDNAPAAVMVGSVSLPRRWGQGERDAGKSR